MIKAVAVDVDGTITDSRRRLCCSAMESLRSAEEKGIPVIIVTGNILPVTKTLSIFMGTSGGLVAENGGVIESPHGRKILGDIEKCQAYVTCYLENDCTPTTTSCTTNDAVCGVNKIGGGNSPIDAATKVYNCACK